jgi:hypothetical protein
MFSDQYVNYHAEDNRQGSYPDNGYFDDIYEGDEQGLVGAKGEYDQQYEEFEPQY